MSELKAQAIALACQQIRLGSVHDQFVVDVIQGDAGTSTNMNTNEVVANLALENLGYQRGEYGFLEGKMDFTAFNEQVFPLDSAQSTTAVKTPAANEPVVAAAAPPIQGTAA